jgi:hypothetical protein
MGITDWINLEKFLNGIAEAIGKIIDDVGKGYNLAIEIGDKHKMRAMRKNVDSVFPVMVATNNDKQTAMEALARYLRRDRDPQPLSWDKVQQASDKAVEALLKLKSEMDAVTIDLVGISDVIAQSDLSSAVDRQKEFFEKLASLEAPSDKGSSAKALYIADRLSELYKKVTELEQKLDKKNREVASQF